MRKYVLEQMGIDINKTEKKKQDVKGYFRMFLTEIFPTHAAIPNLTL